jgi:sugar phosphate isomerase/epimerase
VTLPAGLSRLSLNQATTGEWGVREAVEGCVRAGIPWISLWRDRVADFGLSESAKLVRDAGLRVSSLCRGGFFPANSEAERQRRLDDNRQALDEAAELQTEVLVLVCGGLPEGSRDLDGARQMVADGIEALVPYAAERGVKLGIEPLHPMYCADRSVISSLALANDLAARLASPQVGVVIDVFHVWWDPAVYDEIRRAAPFTLGFHVNDWLAPPPDILLGRGMMGDGSIELRRLREAVDAAGYSGPIEVEIFNREIWDTSGDEVLQTMKERFLSEVM